MIDHLVMSTMFEVHDDKNARDMSSPRRYHSTYDLMTAFGEEDSVHSRYNHRARWTIPVTIPPAYFEFRRFLLRFLTFIRAQMSIGTDVFGTVREPAMHFTLSSPFLPLAKLRPSPMAHHERDNDQN